MSASPSSIATPAISLADADDIDYTSAIEAPTNTSSECPSVDEEGGVNLAGGDNDDGRGLDVLIHAATTTHRTNQNLLRHVQKVWAEEDDDDEDVAEEEDDGNSSTDGDEKKYDHVHYHDYQPPPAGLEGPDSAAAMTKDEEEQEDRARAPMLTEDGAATKTIIPSSPPATNSTVPKASSIVDSPPTVTAARTCSTSFRDTSLPPSVTAPQRTTTTSPEAAAVGERAFEQRYFPHRSEANGNSSSDPYLSTEPPHTLFPHQLADRQSLMRSITTLSAQVQHLSLRLRGMEEEREVQRGADEERGSAMTMTGYGAVTSMSSLLPPSEDLVQKGYNITVAESHIQRLTDTLAEHSLSHELDRQRVTSLQEQLSYEQRERVRLESVLKGLQQRLESERAHYSELDSKMKTHDALQSELEERRLAEQALTEENHRLMVQLQDSAVRVLTTTTPSSSPNFRSASREDRHQQQQHHSPRSPFNSTQGEDVVAAASSNSASLPSPSTASLQVLQRAFLEMDETAARQDLMCEMLFEPLCLAFDAGVTWLHNKGHSNHSHRPSSHNNVSGISPNRTSNNSDSSKQCTSLTDGNSSSSGGVTNTISNNISHNNSSSSINTSLSQLELDVLLARSDGEASRHHTVYLQGQLDRLERLIGMERRRNEHMAQEHLRQLQELAINRAQDRQIMLDAILPSLEERVRQAYLQGQESGRLGEQQRQVQQGQQEADFRQQAECISYSTGPGDTGDVPSGASSGSLVTTPLPTTPGTAGCSTATATRKYRKTTRSRRPCLPSLPSATGNRSIASPISALKPSGTAPEGKQDDTESEGPL